jgi:lipopolysaccharide export LptBFGC system permease protein LptF
MRKLLSYIKNKITGLFAVILMVFTGMKLTLADKRGEGFVDTAIKILMAVVIGALVLAGLYALFSTTVMPTLVQRVTDMFNYKGA